MLKFMVFKILGLKTLGFRAFIVVHVVDACDSLDSY